MDDGLMKSSATAEHAEAQIRKRRKVAVACDQCRSRKSRCDGIKPVCGECSHRRQQRSPCRYNLEHQKDPERDRYVGTLLKRIQDLERELILAKESRHVTKFLGSKGSSSFITTHHESNLETPGLEESATDGAVPKPVTASRDEELLMAVDAMGANSTMGEVGQGDDNRYYGSSSAVALMQHVYSAINHGSPTPTMLTSSGSPSNQKRVVNQPRLLTNDEVHNAKLFSRSVTDEILDCYWEKIYHLYPFVHKPTFMSAYVQIWRPEQSVDERITLNGGLGGSPAYGSRSVVFHCALNLMLALATQFMDMPLESRQRFEKCFADKAKSLCQVDMFDDGSLPVIQTLLLMTQYLQSTPHPNRCWNCIGIACRMAQALGLYIESPRTKEGLSLLDLEMRRRVWHGCVMLDAVVSMTLGRPLMLHKYRAVPLPSLLSDEGLIKPEIHSDTDPPFIHFFVQTLKLYQILADIIVHVYEEESVTIDNLGQRNRKGFEILQYVLAHDDLISTLEAQIPDHLHWERRDGHSLPADFTAVKILEQQSSVLVVRYLHLRVLLYRPVFTSFCQQVSKKGKLSAQPNTAAATITKASDLPLMVSKPLAIACVENSILLIEQVHLRAVSAATGAWWYNLFYARTAGIVVLLSMICEPIVESITSETLQAAWLKCQLTLSSMQKFSGAVGRCLQSLGRLHEHIVAYIDKGEPQQAHTSSNDLDRILNAQPASDATWNGSFIPLPTDIFGEGADFDWPGPEVSFFDDIFAFPDIGVP